MKRILAYALAVCLLLGLLPTGALAADDVFEVEVDGIVYTNGTKDGDGTYFSGVRPIRAAEGMTEVTLPLTITTTEGGTEKTWSVIVPDGALAINSPSLKVLDMSQLDNLQQMGLQDCTNLTKVILPRQLKYLTELPLDYFKGCTGLTEVVFPENLTMLDSGCFQDCTSLKSIELPDGLTEIRSGCFQGCASLTGVVLPESLTTIGSNCFQGCTSLKSIELPDSLNLTMWSYGCFQDCTGLTDVVLPKGLTMIPDSFFYGCTSLTGVSLPDTVTLVDTNAFCDSGLTGIDLPEGLETLGRACFYGTPMTDLKIPANVTTLHAMFSPYGSGSAKAAEGLKITFMGDLSGIDTPDKTSTIPGSVTVFVQPGTEEPDWLRWNNVETAGAEIPPYRLEVTNSVDGQLDLGSFTISNGAYGRGLFVSFKNTGTEALSGLKVELKTSAPHGRLSSPTSTELQPNGGAIVEFFPNTDLKSGVYTDDLTVTTDKLTINLKIQYTITAITCLSVEPNTLDFGAAYPGGDLPEAQTLTVTAGDHAVELKLNQPEHFTCTVGKTQLAKGESTTVTIRPKAELAAGTYKERIGLSCGEHSGGCGVELQFVVKARPNFTFSVTEMDFGEGKQGFTPQPQVVNVTNSGSSMATITKATLTGDGFEYTRRLAGGYEISGGNTIEEIVGVRPKEGLEDGTYTGALVFEIEDGTTYTIPLKYVVNGVSALSVSPNRLEFGTVEGDYAQPAAQTVTLTNTGRSPMTLKTPESTDYDLGAFSRTTLAAGETATFTVRPKAGLEVRGYATTITVETAQGDTAVVFLSFQVKGTDTLSASPDKLDFGSLKENYIQPDAQTVTVTNTGESEVTLQAPTSTSYDLGALSRTTLAAGETATFTVRPKAELKAGSYTEQIITKTAQGGRAAVAVSFKVEEKGPTFTDVKESDWFYGDVEYAYEKGLMNGVGNNRFDPDGTTTRGQIVTILYRLEGEPAVSGSSAFPDVFSGDYYANAVKWASDHQIVNGYSDGRFGPNDPITREQMAAILYRYAGYKNYDVSARADLSKFTDAGSVSGYAVDAISWANSRGLINGVTTATIVPQGSAIRAQAAAILHRFCENIAAR